MKIDNDHHSQIFPLIGVAILFHKHAGFSLESISSSHPQRVRVALWIKHQVAFHRALHTTLRVSFIEEGIHIVDLCLVESAIHKLVGTFGGTSVSSRAHSLSLFEEGKTERQDIAIGSVYDNRLGGVEHIDVIGTTSAEEQTCAQAKHKRGRIASARYPRTPTALHCCSLYGKEMREIHTNN